MLSLNCRLNLHNNLMVHNLVLNLQCLFTPRNSNPLKHQLDDSNFNAEEDYEKNSLMYDFEEPLLTPIL